jgi:ribose transport system substrate-binding protein
MRLARSRVWKISTLLAVTALVPASALAQSPSAPAASPAGTGGATGVEIAFFAPLANTYVAATIEGINSVAEPAGAVVTQFDTGFDATLEFSQIQDAVAQQRFDAMIIIPLDSVGLVPAAEEAIAAGIAVVNTDLALGPDLTTSEPQLDGQAGSVLTPGSERAINSSNVLLEACENVDPCRVGWIAGVATIDFEIKIKEKLDEIVAANPSIQLVVYRDGGGYLAEPANGIAQDILAANPDLDVLATSGDQMTLGAELAVNDAGLTPGEDILLIGGGGSCPGVQAVTEGRWFGTTLDVPRTEGELGTQIALDWVSGALTTPTGINAQKESGYPLVLTAETIGDFECQFEG